jgi:hypothetical protein
MPEQERQHAPVPPGVQEIQGTHQKAVHSEKLGNFFSFNLSVSTFLLSKFKVEEYIKKIGVL